LVGLVAAVLAAPLPAGSTATMGTAMAIIVGAGLVLDGMVLLFDRPKPPTSGRQVPQEWSRLLAAPVVAVLYGARLGVGPLTILSTWTWWSVTVAAALAGPIVSVATGATFGLVRLIVTVCVSVLSSPGSVLSSPDQGPAKITTVPGDHAHWFATLRRVQRPNRIALNGAGLLALSIILLAGCGTGTGTSGEGAANGQPSAEQRAAAQTDGTEPEPSKQSAGEQLIRPVELEDVVRTAEEKQLMSGLGRQGGTDDMITADRVAGDTALDDMTVDNMAVDDSEPVSSEPQSLAGALMTDISGFEPVDDPMADRFLDIIAASELQPDPTEEIALLETRGFEGGWTRAFRNDANDVAVTSVYQFEDAAEAEFYLEDGLITIGGYGGKFFDIDGLAGVRGFVQYFTDADEDGSEELVSLGAAFQAGPRWYLVYFVGSADTVTADVLIPAITAQRQAA
jgi:hypothetical protein